MVHLRKLNFHKIKFLPVAFAMIGRFIGKLLPAHFISGNDIADTLGVLQNLRGNCEFKGLDPERVRLVHASAKAGRRIKDYVPRAHGRSSPNFHVLVHVEFVAREAQ